MLRNSSAVIRRTRTALICTTCASGNVRRVGRMSVVIVAPSDPLGRLADAELRAAKIAAHTAFDELWKRTTPAETFDRNGAYEWLAQQLGIARADCHIGMFDIEQCKRVVEICNERKER